MIVFLLAMPATCEDGELVYTSCSRKFPAKIAC
jgi:hypothetical protein